MNSVLVLKHGEKPIFSYLGKRFIQNIFSNLLIGISHFLLCFNLYAQKESQAIYFEHLNVENGLWKDDEIMYLNKDSRGFVWIGSMNGVYRFDGFNNPRYYKLDQDTIVGNLVQSNFFEDKESNIWFSTWKGIYRYIRKSDTFESYLYLDSLNKPKTGYRLFHLQSSLNKAWAKVDNEIRIFDTNNPYKFKRLPFTTEGEFFSVDTTTEGQIKQIYAYRWIRNPGIEIFTNKDTFWEKDTFLSVESKSLKIPPPEVSQVLIKNDSLAWLISDQGLLLFNKCNPNSLEVYQTKPFKLMHGVILEAENILFSTYHHGLWAFDPVSGNFKKNSKKTNLQSNELTLIYLDPQGHLWVGNNRKGINYSLFPKQKFKNPLATLASPSPSAKFLLEDHQKRIWVGTANQGIYLFDQNGKKLEHFSYNSGHEYSLNLDVLQHLSKDHQGRIWCLSREALFVYEQRKWKKVMLPQLKETKLFWLTHTNANNSLLVTSKGIYNLTTRDGAFFFKKNTGFSFSQNLSFSQVFENPPNLFVPRSNDELWVYVDDLESKENIKNARGYYYRFSTSLSADTTWVGTSNGLILIDKDYEAEYIFQNDWELGTNSVYGVTVDDFGNWWIPNNQDLYVYYPNQKKLLQVRQEDELKSRTYSEFGALKASDGKLWFGHDEGLTVFHPDSISHYPYPPKVYIDALSVNNIPYKDSIIINELEQINLAHNQNTLSFDLIAVGNYLPKLSRLRYRLVNHSTQWEVISNGESAKFTKIPYGNYVLEIIAIGANGLESPIRSLEIVIRSPIYLRWGFISLLFFFVIGSTWFITVIYRKRKEKIQKLEDEKVLALEQERVRIAQDLHDDLGSGLSTLSLLTETLKQKINNYSHRKELENIVAFCRGLSSNFTETVWIIESRNDFLEKLITYLHKYTVELLPVAKIECEINIPSEIPNVKISGAYRRTVYFSFKEALNNIIKHAKAKKVEINFDIRDQQLFIEIKDDGHGFDPQLLHHSTGNGLLNMKRRMVKINGGHSIETSTAGTRVLFSLPI